MLANVTLDNSIIFLLRCFLISMSLDQLNLAVDQY